jgi:hypothetical protein
MTLEGDESLGERMEEDVGLEYLIGSEIIGYHTKTAKNETMGEESEPWEDGIIVQKGKKRFIIYASFAPLEGITAILDDNCELFNEWSGFFVEEMEESKPE